MGLMDAIKRLFGLGQPRLDERFGAPLESSGGGGKDISELARRLGMAEAELEAVAIGYESFWIPKRDGGRREILAPHPPLKQAQRCILRRVLKRLRSHPAATGFERGRSIVTNARAHVGAAVVVRMDIEKFFTSTSARRVRDYFRAIGWDRKAAALLTRLCTHDDGLPQGAPTSPRLSNLVNHGLDARLFALAESIQAVYTRYADDITFSFPVDNREATYAAIRTTKHVADECGYRIHHRRKLRVARRHQSQRVTGLVVNRQVALPRRTRRWLRAVEHRLNVGQEATLSEAQLAGWRALEHMIETQRG